MSDVNALLADVEAALDMLEEYDRELWDFHARLAFDLRSMEAAAQRRRAEAETALQRGEDELERCQEWEREAVQGRLSRTRAQLPRLQRLEGLCREGSRNLRLQWQGACARSGALAREGAAQVGDYLRRLNLIAGREFRRGGLIPIPAAGGAEGEVYVCVIDSRRYPQTAQHILAAQNMGLPKMLTVDRAGAQARRAQSLAQTRLHPIYDRDEYPPAVFREGGAGADVAYIHPRDNRGAGSTMRWQLSRLPEGARVRIRVI